MTDTSLLITNGRIVNADRTVTGDVLVVNGEVAAVGRIDGSPRVDRTIDADGALLLPGLVDSHTHLAMPTMGTITADDFDSGTRAALAGGTTTVVDFALQTDGSLQTGYQLWRERAEAEAHIDFGLHLAIFETNDRTTAEMRDLVAEGVSSFKVFMAFKDSFMINDGDFLDVLVAARDLGAMVQVHAENGDAIDHFQRGVSDEERLNPGSHGRTRPPTTEEEATSRAIHLAEWAGAPVFFVHVSCREAVDVIARAQHRGAPVFAETCVHYLLLTREELDRPDFEGAKYVCSPPLRGQSDAEQLWASLTTGTLSICSTDHCAFNFCGQKELGRTDFAKIPNGLPSVEHRLPLLYEHGVRGGRITENQLVAVTSAQPAQLFGLDRKGAIAPGMDADITIFDPERSYRISADQQQMNVDYSPFEGWQGRGWPVTVLSRGQVVFADGEILSSRGDGRYIARSRGWGTRRWPHTAGTP